MRAERRSSAMRLILLLMLALATVLPGIAALPPIDRDESRYVQATRQMVESGNPVDIRFQEETRYKKPVGIYWLQSLAIVAGGEGALAPIWHYRLVSVAGMLLAILATFLAGRAMFGTTAGFVSALALTAMFGVAFEGRIAKTDAMLLGLAVTAQGALMAIHSTVRNGGSVWRGAAWLFWIAQGLAILVKGPIVPLISLLTVAALWVFEREGRWLLELKPVRGLLLALLIAAPWLIAITLISGGSFWADSVGTDMLAKVAGGQESHGAPPGYFVLTFFLYAWPLAPLLLAAAMTLPGRREPALLFLFCWLVPWWLLCELVPTKLPHYVLPAYPALALAFGAAGERVPTAGAGWQAWALRGAGAMHALVTLLLAAIAIAAPAYLGAGISVAALAAALLLLGTGWLGWRHAGSERGMLATAVAAALAYGALYGLVAPSLERMWLSPRIVAAMQETAPCADPVLAASGFHEPSLVFLAGTETRLTDIGGVAAHLRAGPSCALALVPVGDEQALAAQLGHDQLDLLARIAGVNYSNGRWLELGLYSLRDAEAGSQ